MIVEPLRGDFGARVRGNGEAIASIDRDAIAALFKEKGALYFSGFQIGLDGFRRFSDQLGRNYHKHGADHRREVADDPSGTIETAQEGMGSVMPHPELRWCPWSPELAWFYCETPSESGGETVVYDGLQIVEAMEPGTRELLASKRITFAYSAPPVFDWRKMLGVDTIDEATEALSMIDNAEYGAFHRFAFDGETLRMTYTIPFLTRTKFVDRPAYVASVLGGYGESARFEDGAPITAELKAELARTCESVAVPIAWRPDELLMVDNTRVLHSRRGFTDVKRRILTRWGDAAV